MSYDFSFEKNSILLIVGGCIAIGILLFVAGFILGLDKASGQPEAGTKQQAPQNQTERKPPVQAAEQHSALSQKPAPAQKESSSSASADSTKPSASQAQVKPAPTTEDGSKGKNEESKEQAGFSLQLGAFQAEDHALKLRDSLKAKGYPVFLFRALDADGHIWHTVRMGHYPDTKKASEAAARFTSKERISAWVRPSDAL